MRIPRDDPDRLALGRLWAEFLSTPFPRAGSLQVGDAFVDLAEEDTYLSGYVDTFVTAGRLPPASVDLDRVIDRRLWDAAPRTDDERRARRALLRYRARMWRLAEQLNAIVARNSAPVGDKNDTGPRSPEGG